MNILITGGTGSLGNALVENIIDNPTFERICIYSRDEHKQEIMKNKFRSDKLRFFIGDVRDKNRLRVALNNIHIVVHAAALKVVPSIEYNPFEAIKTNIIGAQNLIECCTDIQLIPTNSLKVLAISTDKAVHPINLYGATKLCAEKLFINANNMKGLNGPRFSVARYGNVANSNGSVIPLFRHQLGMRSQLTITHDQMSRFWITLGEAVELIKYSLNNMHGREIFVPKMPSFNVKDLAMAMMRDYAPERQWTRVIGIRPGEKLHEEIITKEEMEVTEITPEGYYVINSPRLKIDPIMQVRQSLTSDSTFVERLSQDQLTKMVAAL